VHRQHQQEEHQADREQERDLRAEAGGDGREFGHRFERGEPGLVERQPQRGADERGDDRCRQHARYGARGQRRRVADVPGRQADERVDEERRQYLHERLGPRQPLPRQHAAFEYADRTPQGEVATQALETSENRVHLALYLDAAHDHHAAQHQARSRRAPDGLGATR